MNDYLDMNTCVVDKLTDNLLDIILDIIVQFAIMKKKMIDHKLIKMFCY